MKNRGASPNVKRRVLNKLAPLLDLLVEIEAKEELKFDQAKRMDIPPVPGIYVIYRDKEPVYVGETSNLRVRLLSNHRKGPGSQFWSKLQDEDLNRTDEDVAEIVDNCSFRFLEINSHRGAYSKRRRAEAFLQALFDPRLNFLAVRDRNTRRKRLINEILEAEQENPDRIVGLSDQLKDLKSSLAAKASRVIHDP